MDILEQRERKKDKKKEMAKVDIWTCDDKHLAEIGSSMIILTEPTIFKESGFKVAFALPRIATQAR